MDGFSNRVPHDSTHNGTRKHTFLLPSISAAVGVPLGLLSIALIGAIVGGDLQELVQNPRTGIFETVTGALALSAAVVGFAAFLSTRGRCEWRVRAWLLAYALAIFYFAGEDLNWGQYYIGWTPSDYFIANNKEQETNLHNMSPLFNQLPRAIVEVWLLVACILVPLGWQWPRRVLSRLVPNWLWPDQRLVCVAVLALLLKVPKLLERQGLIDTEVLYGIRTSELQELMFAYAFLLYALLLRQRATRFSVDRTPRLTAPEPRGLRRSGRVEANGKQP